MVDLRLVTWNLRGASFADGPNAWSKRRPLVREILSTLDAGIVVTQECEAEQLADLADWFPDHDWYPGCPYNRSGRVFFCVVGVDPARVAVASAGSRYLGRPWAWRRDGDAARIHVGTALHLSAPAPLWVVDTHLDHLSAAARRRGLRALAVWGTEVGGDAIIAGDFNADPGGTLIQAADGFRDAVAIGGAHRQATCRGFLVEPCVPARYDGFLWRDGGGGWTPVAAGVVELGSEPPVASDHNPVWLDCRHA